MYSQQEVNTTFATQMNAMFGQLNKTRVPHGILLDYGMEFTNVPAFNGTLTDSTHTNAINIKQLYNTLLSSRVVNTTPAMVAPTVFEENWNNKRSAGVIALCGIYYKYSRFSYNATLNNKLTFSNNKFYDKTINGVWQNPYEVLQTFAIAPPIDQYDQKSMQVVLPNELFYTNSTSSVTAIAIDFDNGLGYQNITRGQAITVSYTTAGLKTWKYRLSLTGGIVLYNQSKIQIGGTTDYEFGPEIPLPYEPVCELCRTAPSEAGMLITATTAYQGVLGRARITIDYAGDPSLGIRRPLIVAEGFDVGALLNPEKVYGNNTYLTFRKILEFGGQALRNLIYEDFKQYDIIYVDWVNGVDFMQRNAYALEEVIKYVNARKVNAGSTTPNVVLGQSMGGVIARYALADMEQRGLPHQTALFVSHDAPQQGANVPISLQYMYRHLTKQYIRSPFLVTTGEVLLPLFGDTPRVSTYLSVLDAPASRQLLKNSINANYSMDNTTSPAFFDELKSKGLANSGGYPMLCRNVAISNGSECGGLQNFNPGDDIVNFSYNKSLSFWGDLASLVYNPLGFKIAGAITNNPNFYVASELSQIPGNSKYNVNFICRSLYNTPGNEIYKGRVAYTKKVAWLFNVTVNILNESRSQPSNILPLDTYGGGFNNTKEISSTLNLKGLYVRDRFSFIPTVSALDIGRRNVILNDFDYKKAYVGAIPLVTPKDCPFDNFITDFDKANPNSNNQSHISFNTRNGDWLAAELIATTSTSNPLSSNCSFVCNNGASEFQIVGTEALCSNATYTAPVGAQIYSWAVTENPNLVTISGASTNTLLVNQVSAESRGYITLTLFMGSEACGYTTLTKRVYVGYVTPNATIISDYCNGYSQEVTLELVGAGSNVSNISFSNFITNGNAVNPNVSYYQTSTSAAGNPCFVVSIPKSSQPTTNYYPFLLYNLSYTNNCGQTVTQSANYRSIKNCYPSYQTATTYKVFPNPTADVVNIELTETTTSSTAKASNAKSVKKTEKLRGKIFDMNNIQKQDFMVDDANQINISNLPSGIYVLEMEVDGVLEHYKIIKE